MFSVPGHISGAVYEGEQKNAREYLLVVLVLVLALVVELSVWVAEETIVSMTR